MLHIVSIKSFKVIKCLLNVNEVEVTRLESL